MKTTKRQPLTYLTKKPLTSLLLLPRRRFAVIFPPDVPLSLWLQPQSQPQLQLQSLLQSRLPLKRLNRGVVTLTGLITTLLVFSTTSNAALTATTAQTIEGTPPYLTFDGGFTKTTNTDGLLMIKLSDGTVYKASDAAGTAMTPIVLPTGDT